MPLGVIAEQLRGYGFCVTGRPRACLALQFTWHSSTSSGSCPRLKARHGLGEPSGRSFESGKKLV